MQNTDPVEVFKLKKIERDENGLIKDDNLNYIFDRNGKVDWRRMIPAEFLVPNLERTKETDISKLKDSEILVLLAGWKYLLSLRGYSNLYYSIKEASQNYCCITCNITWIPNYETEGREISFESIADAHAGNTDPKMGLNYLASIAENRAFVRCVRNFLRINVLGKDELKGEFKQAEESQAVQEDPVTPKNILKKLMIEKDISFEKIKERLSKDGYEGVEALLSVDDIPPAKIFELISRLKKLKS